MVHLNFDEVLQEIGELGRYQIILYVLMGLTGLPSAWQNLAMVFVGGKMDFWCADRDSIDRDPPWMSSITDTNNSAYNSSANSSLVITPSRCTKRVYAMRTVVNGSIPIVSTNGSDIITERCTSWIYDRSLYFSTIVSQYDLVCDREWMVATATSIYMIGFLVGTVLFGTLSDRFGRHKTLILCIFLQMIFGVAGAFAPYYAVFVVLRFVVGACSAGSFTVGFVIVMETIGPTKRMSPGIFYQGWFSLGIMIEAGLAYGLPNHQHLQLAISVPVILLFSYWWIVSESPRWLVFANRMDEAAILVKKIARINGRPETQLRGILQPKTVEEVRMLNSQRKPNIIDILRSHNSRNRTLNVCCHWCVISLVYYGLSLGSGSLGGSVYVNHFLSGFVEIPSFFLTIFTIDRFGRKNVMIALHLFGGVACLACIPLLHIPHLQPLLVTFAMVGKFAVAANFAVIYMYSAEVFPTVVRNVGVGTGSMCARIGSLLAPQISRLDFVWGPLPFLVYGGMPILCSFLVIFLPETLHQKLPETLEDGEHFGRTTFTETEIPETELNEFNGEAKALTDVTA